MATVQHHGPRAVAWPLCSSLAGTELESFERTSLVWQVAPLGESILAVAQSDLATRDHGLDYSGLALPERDREAREVDNRPEWSRHLKPGNDRNLAGFNDNFTNVGPAGAGRSNSR